MLGLVGCGIKSDYQEFIVIDKYFGEADETLFNRAIGDRMRYTVVLEKDNQTIIINVGREDYNSYSIGSKIVIFTEIITNEGQE